jgi:deoxycytidylate deaminase
MKQKFKEAYMDTAIRFAELSHAIRLKVGAIIVKDDRIISIGFNGTPSGWDNNCEYLPDRAGQLNMDNTLDESKWFDSSTNASLLKTTSEV